MSNWFGVSVSHDGGQHWSGNHYEGIENICVENVVAHPTKPGCFYFAAPDQAICRSDDDGRHFQHFGDVRRPANYYCSTCAAPSRFTTGLVVYGVNNNGSQHSAFCRTEDDGATVTCSLELPGRPDDSGDPGGRDGSRAYSLPVSTENWRKEPVLSKRRRR